MPIEEQSVKRLYPILAVVPALVGMSDSECATEIATLCADRDTEVVVVGLVAMVPPVVGRSPVRGRRRGRAHRWSGM